EFLLRRMRLKGEFPALSANLVAINQLTAEGGNASVKTLSQIILRDYALANRLLKLVNSAFYGSGRQPITTVSDAVMRLGFEQVRIACNALLYAGCLVDTDPERAARLRNMQVEALLAGLLARYVATTSRFGDPEELFLCGMLRHLGETLAAYCFPEEFAYIAGMIGSGMHPDQAFREVLGVTEPEIALAVGAEWKLPATFVNSMRPLPEGLVTVPADAAGRTLVVAAFANDLCRIATRAPAGEADLRLGALSTRFEPCIKTAPEALRTLLVSAARKLDDFLPALGLKAEDTPALARVRDWIPAPD
ncbi:MAG: HDOD domain-containing protein, partial [Gammaproteobacteria bacterium]